MKILKLQTQANTSAQMPQAALHFTAWRVDILLSAHSQPKKHYTSLHIQDYAATYPTGTLATKTTSAPEIHLRTDQAPPEACVASVIGYLHDQGYLLQRE